MHWGKESGQVIQTPWNSPAVTFSFFARSTSSGIHFLESPTKMAVDRAMQRCPAAPNAAPTNCRNIDNNKNYNQLFQSTNSHKALSALQRTWLEMELICMCRNQTRPYKYTDLHTHTNTHSHTHTHRCARIHTVTVQVQHHKHRISWMVLGMAGFVPTIPAVLTLK